LTGFINYYLEISGASDQSSVSSLNNIFKGRQFAPLPSTIASFDQKDSSIIISERTIKRTITIPSNSIITIFMKKANEEESI
jgi:hypothetical protein